jgi:peptidyl-prolyl cis-trans isomerase A (cyclophilin A)
MTPISVAKPAAMALVAISFISLAAACGERGGPLLNPSDAELAKPAPDSFRVDFETSRGRFSAVAHRSWAPHGVDRFHYLVRHHYYDSAAFFRVVEGFVAQFGMAADPRINAAWEERRIADDPVRRSNDRGTISFASKGPGTRTVQLFINLKANPKLDSLAGGFAPIAEVVEGMPVVDSLYWAYGEGEPRGLGPRQDLIARQGNTYLRRFFPQLHYVVRATIAMEWR